MVPVKSSKRGKPSSTSRSGAAARESEGAGDRACPEGTYVRIEFVSHEFLSPGPAQAQATAFPAAPANTHFHVCWTGGNRFLRMPRIAAIRRPAMRPKEALSSCTGIWHRARRVGQSAVHRHGQRRRATSIKAGEGNYVGVGLVPTHTRRDAPCFASTRKASAARAFITWLMGPRARSTTCLRLAETWANWAGICRSIWTATHRRARADARALAGAGG